MSQELEAVRGELAAIREALGGGLVDTDKLAAALAGALTASQETPEAGQAKRAAVEAMHKDAPEPRTKSVGDLVSHRAFTPEVVELQRANDCLHLAGVLFESMPERARAEVGVNSIKDTAAWRHFEMVAKAVDTTDWANWVPTGYSTTLLDDIQVALQLAGLVPTINIGRSPWEYPVRMSSVTRGFRITESTADVSAKLPTSDPQDAKVTFTAQTHGARTLLSYETLRDSTVDGLSEANYHLTRLLALDTDDCILNGDASGQVAGSHMDSVVTSAADPRAMYDGWRAHGIDGSDTYDCAEATIGTAAWEQGDVVQTLKKMGKYALNPSDNVLIMSVGTMLKCMDAVNFPSFVTIEKIADQAFARTGAPGYLWGRRIVVTDRMSSTLHTDGKDNGSTAATGLIIPCLACWRMGLFGPPLLETQRVIGTRQVELVASKACDLKCLFAITEPTVGYGINIPL